MRENEAWLRRDEAWSSRLGKKGGRRRRLGKGDGKGFVDEIQRTNAVVVVVLVITDNQSFGFVFQTIATDGRNQSLFVVFRGCVNRLAFGGSTSKLSFVFEGAVLHCILTGRSGNSLKFKGEACRVALSERRSFCLIIKGGETVGTWKQCLGFLMLDSSSRRYELTG